MTKLKKEIFTIVILAIMAVTGIYVANAELDAEHEMISNVSNVSNSAAN